MSAKILGQVWDLKLPAPKLMILLALADHADHNGNNVFPSVELIAWKTGYSETQARRIMKALVRDEILEANPRPGRTTIYSIHLDKGIKKTPFKGYQKDTPDKLTPLSLDDTPTPAIQMTPEPSFEPSKKKEPRNPLKVSTGKSYPVELSKWTRVHIESYYAENKGGLDALTRSNTDDIRDLLHMSKADGLNVIERYQDCIALNIPVDCYPSVVTFTKNRARQEKKTWTWRSMGWYIGQYKIIKLDDQKTADPALDTRALNAALFREGAG